MKKKFFQVSSILLGALLLVPTITGCSQNSAEQPSVSSKPTEAAKPASNKITDTSVEISWMMREDPQFPIVGDSPFFKKLQEITGVKVNPIPVPDSELTKKLNLAAASGNLPDIVQGSDLDFFLRYGVDGAFAPLNDLIDKYAPDIKKYMQNPLYAEAKFWAAASNGKQYVIPTFRTQPSFNSHFMIRTDWLNQLNLKAPQDINELYSVLKTIKEKDPAGGGKTIPFSTINKLNMNHFYTLFDINYEYFVDNGVVKLGAIDDRMKTAIQWLATFQKEGLMQKEFLSVSEDQYYEGVYGNKVAVALNSTSRINAANDALEKNFAGKGYTFELLEPMKSATGVRRGDTDSMLKQPIAINAKSKNQEIAVKLLNFFFTDEGVRLVNMGIGQGVDLGIATIKDNKYTITPDSLDKMKQFGAMIYQTPLANTYQPVIDKPNKTQLAEQLLASKYTFTADLSKTTVGTKFRFTKFTPDETKRVAELVGPIFSLRDEYLSKFITGLLPMDKWDEYTGKMKALKVEELMSIYNTGYKRYVDSAK